MGAARERCAGAGGLPGSVAGVMRVAVISDLHGNLPPVPACELLLLGGDLCPAVDHGHEHQAAWLDGEFRSWLEAAPAGAIVGIAGNHDFVFERQPELVPSDLPWTYLQDSSAEVGGLTIWGSPWTPWFFDWAFNSPKGEEAEPFFEAKFAAVPPAADVLLIHGPPHGYGDRTVSGIHAGSTAQLDLIDRLHPRLCAFGHIHEARGLWHRGETTLVNSAAVDLQYELRDEPFELLEL